MLTHKQKTEWVEALRSGKYKQGKYALYDGGTDSYCCLGVLSKINGCYTSTGDYEYLDEEIHSVINLGIDENKFNFDGNLKKTGAKNLTPDLIEKSLSALNDDGRTFDEIATIIENYLPTKD